MPPDSPDLFIGCSEIDSQLTVVGLVSSHRDIDPSTAIA